MTYEQLYEYYSTLRDKRVLTAKLCCEEARFDAEARVEMVDMVLDAIDKQIAKKPKHEHLNFYCPNCGNWLLWDDAEPNDNDLFCPKCGQHILWG